MIEYCRAYRLRIRPHGEESWVSIKDVESGVVVSRKVATSDNIQEALHILQTMGIEIQSHFFYKEDIFLIGK